MKLVNMSLPNIFVENRYLVDFVPSVGLREIAFLGAMHGCGSLFNFACKNQYDAELWCEV